MIEVSVVGIRLEETMNAPILMLQEVGGDGRVLELWIGAVEAGAIAFAQQGVTPPRPMTHQLMLDVLLACGQSLASVVITDLRSGTFFSELRLASGGVVSARPSDAVALAVHAKAPIYVVEEVLNQAAVPGESSSGPVAEEEQIEEFREFLENLNPEDFAG